MIVLMTPYDIYFGTGRRRHHVYGLRGFTVNLIYAIRPRFGLSTDGPLHYLDEGGVLRQDYGGVLR